MIENVRTHPLTQMIEMYCHGYDRLRDEWLDLPPMAFHRRYGLVVQVPVLLNPIVTSMTHWETRSVISLGTKYLLAYTLPRRMFVI